MNYYFLGAGAILGAGIIGAIIYLYCDLQDVKSQLIQARQKNVDDEIVRKTHILSDAELDALLVKDLGPGNSKS
jgi:hypothetical protein